MHRVQVLVAFNRQHLVGWFNTSAQTAKALAEGSRLEAWSGSGFGDISEEASVFFSMLSTRQSLMLGRRFKETKVR